MLLNKQGNVIDQRPKDSHSEEIQGRGKFSGHRFLLKTKLFGDKRCIYCGKWYHWKDTDSFEWLRTNNIDDMNKDSALEPLHCGSSHCQDYHHRYLKAVEQRRIEAEADRERKTWALFNQLKSRGVIS